MTTYGDLRQQVLSRLGPDVPGATQAQVLRCVLHAAICGDAQAAALDLLTHGGPERYDLAELDDFGAALDACYAREIARGVSSDTT
jgi:hypothetical protein